MGVVLGQLSANIVMYIILYTLILIRNYYYFKEPTLTLIYSICFCQSTFSPVFQASIQEIRMYTKIQKSPLQRILVDHPAQHLQNYEVVKLLSSVFLFFVFSLLRLLGFSVLSQAKQAFANYVQVLFQGYHLGMLSYTYFQKKHSQQPLLPSRPGDPASHPPSHSFLVHGAHN